MNIKRILTINDMSGIGRCSLTVFLPVLSAMGFQPVPMPTALLSAHTGYENVFFTELTECMSASLNKYIEAGERFEAVATGFLGAPEQAEVVGRVFDAYPDAYKFADPVMGDDGRLYSTYTPQLCESIKRLCRRADTVTPNLTEACILAGEDYCGASPDDACLHRLCLKIADLGPGQVVITGVVRKKRMLTYCYDRRTALFGCADTPLVTPSFPGTGDLFASILLGRLMQGRPLGQACKFASRAVYRGIKFSAENKFNVLEGIAFEPLLKKLL